jgi:lactate permease
MVLLLENWTVLISFLILLLGVFVFRKLWLGALLALLFVFVSKAFLLQNVGFGYLPFLSGFVISIELALLLFGAYLFYHTLYASGHFTKFIEVNASFSSKLFVILILCVFMGSFMEGIAGFGIPAMLIAPLLLTLGFKPLTSIVLPLVANTTAVTFGALGTPFKVGLGIYESDSTVLFTLILNSLPALVLPFLLAYIYSQTEQSEIHWKKDWKMLAGAGFSFTIPYLLTGLVSVEYPSVVAGFVGLVLFVSIFVNKSERPDAAFWLDTFYPYLILVLLLVLAKYFLSDFNWKINQSTRPLSLYQPGGIFMLTSLVYLVLIQKKRLSSHLFSQCKETLLKTGKSMATIFLLVCFAQLIQGDLLSIINSHYMGLQQTTKLLLNPLIGVTGSFISGSATMSNLLLGNAINADETVGKNLPLILALLHTGSAIGNAISLQNIIMVKSVVNQPLIGYAKLMKHNLLLVGVYVVLVIIVALLIRN